MTEDISYKINQEAKEKIREIKREAKLKEKLGPHITNSIDSYHLSGILGSILGPTIGTATYVILGASLLENFFWEHEELAKGISIPIIIGSFLAGYGITEYINTRNYRKIIKKNPELEKEIKEYYNMKY